MIARGRHEWIAAASPPPEPQADGAAPGWSARRSLPVRAEIRRQRTRRRTQAALGFLVVLPFLLVGAFALGGDDPGRDAPGLVALATTGAANFAVFTLFASTGFLLVVVVALFCGDAVASEASWSSLRYLLAAPVPRGHLLARKLVVALLFSLAALVLLPLVAFAVGGVAYGWAPLTTPLGGSVPFWPSVLRLLLVVGYLAVWLLFVAALAFLLGVHTDAPLGAVGGAVLIVIVSTILDAVTALGRWREALPTHHSFAWIDVLGPDIAWSGMARGALWSIGYAVVLFALAWRHFGRKDVTS